MTTEPGEPTPGLGLESGLESGPVSAPVRMVLERLETLLDAGLPQDQASLDAVLAALGEADAYAALARLAVDPEDAEHAPLVALLLSPGPQVKRLLEPVLAAADLDKTQAEELAERLAARRTKGRAKGQTGGAGQALALLPDGALVQLAAPAEGLRCFVRRLRPQATAPAELRAVIARRCGTELGLALCVLLRHSRLDWTPEQLLFVLTLLDRARLADSRQADWRLTGGGPEGDHGPEPDDLAGLLAWAVGFLDTCGQAAGLRADGLLPDGLRIAPHTAPQTFNLRSALAARRQALLAQLRQAEHMEEAMARGNYETLLAQGVRFAHVHGPDARAELAFLERAGLLALGLPVEELGAELGAASAAQDGVHVRDLGQADDVQALLRLLPGAEG